MNQCITPARINAQHGLTMVELLVSLGLGMLVVVIALAALTMGQQGYRAVDASTDLRDRERFAKDLISRVLIQAGYQDFGVSGGVTVRSSATLLGVDPEPDLFGWNNAVYATPIDLILSTGNRIVGENRPGSCTVNDTSCKNGSDVLVVRFQGVSALADAADSDNTMINCMGRGETGIKTADLDTRATSIFSVTRGLNGEPSLSCSTYSGTAWATNPMIEGVESFQVLFGTDQVTASIAPNTVAVQDSVADRWLRADQLTVTGNASGTRENWRRVRAIRVGLVLRGAPGSAQQSVSTIMTPLGNLYASSSDAGSSLTVAADGRLRLQSTFTVHMRNDLTLR